MIRRSDIGRSAILASKHIIDKSIPAAKLEADAIKIVEEFVLLSAAQDVAADATGTPAFPHSANILRDETVENVKAAEVIMDFAWAATADGTIQIYDETNGVVLAETASFTGGESDDDLILTVSVADLRSGARIVVRGNVTAAGASGEKSTVNRCFMKVIKGYS